MTESARQRMQQCTYGTYEIVDLHTICGLVRKSLIIYVALSLDLLQANSIVVTLRSTILSLLLLLHPTVHNNFSCPTSRLDKRQLVQHAL